MQNVKQFISGLNEICSVKRKIRRFLRTLPASPSVNIVLKDYAEVEEAIGRISNLGLSGHNDKYKNWDIYHMLSFILRMGSKTSAVLDMGCANYGVILPILEQFGFNKLYGCDLVIDQDVKKGSICYSRQDLQSTSYADNSFDFIMSISVIEHGVNIDRYLDEAARLLKPGGYLLTTTDYWPSPVETKGIFPYGELGEMKIFTQADIEQILLKTEQYGLKLINPMDYSFKDKVIHWERVDKRFTFIYFVLVKDDVSTIVEF